MNLSASSFLEKLRINTSKLHIALEELSISKVIISPDLSVNDYLQYLGLMYNVVYDIEENIYPLLNNIIEDIDSRKKSHYIKSDLNTIHSNYKIIDRKPISNITTITTGFALGIMYVIEGSTLGGRVILKNIHQSLGYNENNGARYFAGYGAQTGSSWKNFLAMMIEYQEQCNCDEEIIDGANYAFTTMAKYFKENSSI